MHGSISENGFPTPPGKTIDVPDVIPIFPLPTVVLLPGEVLPLHIFEPRYLEMIRDSIASHHVIGMVEVMPGFENDLPGSPPVREVGCVGFIASHEELPDGRYLLWLFGLERFRIEEELDANTQYRQARVRYEPTPESPKRLAEIRPLRQELRSLLPSLVDLDGAAREQFARHMDDASDSQLIALTCQVLEISSDRKQAVLEAGSLSDRFLMIYEDLYRHLDLNPEIEGPESEQVH
jgi:Lon protease-like protein